jgi:hypothetical protein
VRALRTARTRLRDIAAADCAVAAHARELASGAASDAATAYSHALDAAAGALAGARTVEDLVRVAAQSGEQQALVVDANRDAAVAAAAAEQASARLRARARQLRVADKLLEQVQHQRARRDSRADRLASDDLAARRK